MYAGTIFTTIGGKIKQIVQGPTTETLLIIGTAQDGPLNKPVRIEDAAQAERVFGPAKYSAEFLDPNTSTESGKPAGATIPLAISQALAAGNRSLYAVRAAGTFATGTLGTSGLLYFKSLNPGRLYNQATVTTSLSGGMFILSLGQPKRKGGTIELIREVASTTTLSELMDKINGTTKNKVGSVSRTLSVAQNYMAYTLDTLAVGMTGTVTLSGGTNGCFAKGDDYGPELMTSAGSGLAGFAKALVATMADDGFSGTFETLQDDEFNADVIVLDGICVDDQIYTAGNAATNGSYTIAADFVDFIDRLSTDTNPCHGIISTRLHNLTETSDLVNYVNNNLLATDFGYYDQGKKWLKSGPFLLNGRLRADAMGGVKDLFTNVSVCAGPGVVYNHPDMGGDYVYNFHVGYAALLTTIPPERSATFVRIPGVRAYGTPYPASAARRLLDGVGANLSNNTPGKGAYVILSRDPNSRGNTAPLIVWDDPTAAARDDVFRNYQTLHLVNSVHKDLKAVLFPFIGGPTSAGVLATMEAAVQNVLDGYTNSQALRGGKGQGYTFKVTMDGTDMDLGTANVFVELVPATSLRRINFIVSVRRGG